jgi:predicted nucleotidyltransferase
MFSKLFEERDKTISLLVKLGDCLSRSLRENITLFSIDSNNSQVTYLSESNKVISGDFEINKDVKINHIKVQDSSIFEDGREYDTFVNEKIHSFVEGIHYGEYSSAEESFDDILSLWENRLKLGSVQRKLHEKASKLEAFESIIESTQFQKIVEISPQLQDFLKENIDKISTVPEIKNAVNLSNSVSQAFNFPELSYDQLSEGKSYTLKDGVTPSIYDMICRQELVKKELVESKKNFDLIWADNDSIRKLSSTIFESDETVVTALSEALKDVPYLALASKKNLNKTFNNCLSQVDGIGVSEKDIQGFASKIFEYKKEVKEMFITSINEKYGVNIQNLQEPASFKSLANTQVVIFESLSRLATTGSVLKGVLSEMAEFLKGKSGVQTIDVNTFLHEMFIEAGYGELLGEATAAPKQGKVDFKRIAKNLGDAQDVITSLQKQTGGNPTADKDEEYSSDENVDQAEMKASEAEPALPEEAPEEQEVPPQEEPEMPKTQSQDKMVNDLSDLESMVADIAAEIGSEDQEEN